MYAYAEMTPVDRAELFCLTSVAGQSWQNLHNRANFHEAFKISEGLSGRSGTDPTLSDIGGAASECSLELFLRSEGTIFWNARSGASLNPKP